jgi:uncharacterized membrane protein YqjE
MIDPSTGGDVHTGEAGPASRMLQSMQSLVASLLSIVSTRVELISTEIEEEALRVATIVAIALAAMFCTGVAIMLVVAFVVVAFWETHRLLAIALLAAAFALASVVLYQQMQTRYRARSRLFSASLGELAKDHDRLTAGRL